MFIDTKSHISQYPTTFYRVSLKAIIRNEENEILVHKELDATFWNLPGGGWDHGETEKEALARELEEEIGFKGDFTAKPINTAVFWLESKKAWLLWIVYDVKTENQDFVIGEHSSIIKFINPEELKNSAIPEEKWIYENCKIS